MERFQQKLTDILRNKDFGIDEQQQSILLLIKESLPDEISSEEALCMGLDSCEGAEGWDAYRTELLTKLGLEE